MSNKIVLKNIWNINYVAQMYLIIDICVYRWHEHELVSLYRNNKSIAIFSRIINKLLKYLNISTEILHIFYKVYI